MSDTDDNDKERNPVEGFLIPVSAEELLNRQRNVQDRINMAHQEYRQSVMRFFDEMSPEHLYTFFRILQNIASLGDEGRDTANYLAGQVNILLRKVHKVCPGCGNRDHTDHDTFLAGMTGDFNGGADSGTEKL